MLFFEYVAERSQYYRRFITILAFLCTASIVLTIVTVFSLNSEVSDYPNVLTTVERIYEGSIKMKTGSVFSVKEWKYDEALLINTKSGLYYVDDSQNEQWSKLIQRIKPGDQLKIYYQVVDNNREIVHLESEKKVLISFEERQSPGFYFLLVFAGVSLLFVLAMITLVNTRKKILREGWNSQ